MDIEKLIERLRKHRVIYKTNYDEFSGGACTADCVDAADIISTLQAENEQLRSDLRRLQTERDALLAANQHLLAEREQLTAERDAAVERLREWEKFNIYLLAHNFLIPEKWRGPQKED